MGLLNAGLPKLGEHELPKSEWVQASIEEVFADSPEFLSELKNIRGAAHEAARFIKTLRRGAELTQRELATRLGISQPRVSAMERGIGPEGPSYLMLKRVAKACGVPWSLETGLGLGLQRRKPENEAEVIGGAGSDTFVFAQPSEAELTGGAGNVGFVFAQPSEAELTGGAESDTFVFAPQSEAELTGGAGDDIFVFAQQLGSTDLVVEFARLVEEVLQSNAPRALRPAEIRSAIQRDKGVAMAFTSIRNALGQLEARHVAEQVAESKTWRYRSGGGGSARLRRDRTT
jgi:transcriptional regulator with XRE-family HTH domain